MLKGSKMTKEARLKISNSLKGNKFALGFKHSEETRKKISIASKKQDHSWKIGRTIPFETRQKMSKLRLGKSQKGWNKSRGQKHWNWKGGITPINETFRKSPEYKLWRESVYKRDNYQCVWGGKEHGNKLHADHIKPFSLYPELRLAIDNGRTLCVSCHLKTDTYAGRVNKYNIQL